MASQPEFTESLQEMDAGLINQLLSQVQSDVSLGVVEHSKVGKVTLTLDYKQIEKTSQVIVTHKVSFIKPTKRGKQTEEYTTNTPMYVNKNGHLSVSPDSQIDLFKTKTMENT